nr:immunoglobulin heavy chain junction region [Macaca mulatta]
CARGPLGAISISVGAFDFW